MADQNEDIGHEGSDDNVLVMEQAEIHENNNSIDMVEEPEIHANSITIDMAEEPEPREVDQTPAGMADGQPGPSRQGPAEMTYGQQAHHGYPSAMMSSQQAQHIYPSATMSGQTGQPAQHHFYPPAPVHMQGGQPTPSYPFNASAQFHVTPPPAALLEKFNAKLRENKEREEAEKRREASRQWEARMRQKLCQECVSKRKTLTDLQQASLFNTLLCQKVCSICSTMWPVMFFAHKYDVSAGTYVPTEDMTCLGQSRSVRLCRHRTFNMEQIQAEYRRVTEAGPLPKMKETTLAECKECFQGLGIPLQRPKLTTVGIEKKGEEGRKFDLSWNVELEWIKEGEEEEYQHLMCPHRNWFAFRDWAMKGVAAAVAAAAAQGTAAQGKAATVPKTGRFVCNVFGCQREYSWSKNNSNQPLVKSRLKILELQKGQDLSCAVLDPHIVELLPEDLERLESADKKHILWCDSEAEKRCLINRDERRALYHHVYWLIHDDYWPNQKVLAEERARDEQEGRSSPGQEENSTPNQEGPVLIIEGEDLNTSQEEHTFPSQKEPLCTTQEEHTLPSRKEPLYTIQEEDLCTSQEENLNSSQELQSASSQEEHVSLPQKECPFRDSVFFSDRPRSGSCSPEDPRARSA